MDDSVLHGRDWLKASWWLLEGLQSDQQRKIPAPPLQQPCDPGLSHVDLPGINPASFADITLGAALAGRQSRRQYDTAAALGLDELAFLLWATQGVRQVAASGKASLRTVPSGGSRHTFETYLAVRRVTGLKPGIYRYLPFDNRLVYLGLPEQYDTAVSAACLDQRCAVQAAVLFVWATIPYRAEWRYGPVSHKMIAIDAGHVCQNLYLACEAIGCGTVAVGAYDQQALDALLGVDGSEQFAVYAAPVGRLPQGSIAESAD